MFIKFIYFLKIYIDNIHKNIKIQIKNMEILIIFDDMIADVLRNKKVNTTVTELFIRVIKLNIFLVFIMQPYFFVPKKYESKSYAKFQTNQNFIKLKLIIHKILTLKTL